MGVAMLPRLAAIVSNTTRERTEPVWRTLRVTSRVNGTKVIKVTSLVMTILLKKHLSLIHIEMCIRDRFSSKIERKRPAAVVV